MLINSLILIYKLLFQNLHIANYLKKIKITPSPPQKKMKTNKQTNQKAKKENNE